MSRYEKGERVHSGNYAEQDMESEDDESLEYVAVILAKIHRAFYELFDDAKVNRFPVRSVNFSICFGAKYSRFSIHFFFLILFIN